MAETTTINVPTRFPATLLVEAGEGPSLLFNNDAVNTVWLGDNNAIEAGDSLHTIALPPQSGVNVSGDVPLFGISSGGVIQVKKLPGGTSFSNGTVAITGPVTATISGTVTANLTGTNNVTIAGQTAALNVSAATVNISPAAGYVLPGQTANVISNTSTNTIAANTQQTFGIVDCGIYQSLDFKINAFSNSQATAGASICAILRINFYDDAGGTNPVYAEDVSFYLTNTSGGASPLFGRMPMAGRYIQLTIINLGTGASITVNNITVTGSFRTPVYSSWRQLFPGTGNLTITGVILDQFRPTVANFSNDFGNINNITPGTGLRAYLLPLFSGPVWFTWVVNTAALLNQPTLVDLSEVTSGNLAAGTGQVGWITTLPNVAGTAFQGMIQFPRSPCALVVNPAATSVIQASAVGQQGY